MTIIKTDKAQVPSGTRGRSSEERVRLTPKGDRRSASGSGTPSQATSLSCFDQGFEQVIAEYRWEDGSDSSIRVLTM